MQQTDQPGEECQLLRRQTPSYDEDFVKGRVEFKYKLGWRFGEGAGCTQSLIGNYVNKDTYPWICTSGCGSSPVTLSSKGYVCAAASRIQDWEQGEYSFRHTFKSDGRFTVSYESCCWIALNYGKGDGNWSLQTTVDLRTRSDLHVPNSSPLAAGKPTYTIKYGCTQKITIPILDRDGDSVKCRWASGDECMSVCKRIPHTVLDEGKCTLTISAKGKANDTYAVAIMVEDRPTSSITLNGQVFTQQDVLSSIPVQFLVNTPEISSMSCSDRPVFVSPTPAESDVIVVFPGRSLFVSFYAASRGTSITSFLVIGPPGAQQSTIRQLSLRRGVYSTDIAWTPSAVDRGPQSLCAEATDAYLISSDMRCLTIAAWDINPCNSKPCQNNGKCSRVGYTKDFLCTCLPGYTGLQCQIDINECASNPCLHGATCFDLINEYFCGCISGYTNVNCQTDINECELQTCENGGTCQDNVNTAVCDCAPGFTGEICQTGNYVKVI
ncbi:uncharacterized protein LOC128551583 [Mercenaria mercenaria]|uniref:uncharacterized protein LOC128551583 n=1 Tax=Mercenaria mercenaria TaxID=6596 RepID=UPI00234F0388|nr:uncharacterized protein LOC128551583 [Mercenaria mercenaria]